VGEELTKEGLVVNKKKPKHPFGKKELVQFTITFWTVDDDQPFHPSTQQSSNSLYHRGLLLDWRKDRRFLPREEGRHQEGTSVPV
jgi:hypothetical protein